MIEDLEEQLIWKWSHKVGAKRGSSHGGGYAPEPAYLEDFELDRDKTPADALEWYDALESADQMDTEGRAHDRKLENID